MISFMHQKNIFSEDNFFVSKSMLAHDLWPQHATDMWLRIKNFSMSWTFMSISKFYVILPTLQHVSDMLTTFPTKFCYYQHFVDINNFLCCNDASWYCPFLLNIYQGQQSAGKFSPSLHKNNYKTIIITDKAANLLKKILTASTWSLEPDHQQILQIYYLLLPCFPNHLPMSSAVQSDLQQIGQLLMKHTVIPDVTTRWCLICCSHTELYRNGLYNSNLLWFWWIIFNCVERWFSW